MGSVDAPKDQKRPDSKPGGPAALKCHCGACFLMPQETASCSTVSSHTLMLKGGMYARPTTPSI